MAAPSLAQVLDFLEDLASGACMDRGKGRASNGMCVCVVGNAFCCMEA